jgi:hypothetical protein
MARGKDVGFLTVEKERGKLDTDVAIPLRHAPALDFIRKTHRLELFNAGEYAVGCPEADYDLGDAEKKGLDPKSHGFPVKLEPVVLAADFGACLEFYPFYGISWSCGLCVPDCLKVSILGFRGGKCDCLLASTSPPRQTMVLPKPVRTTEQYCSLLLTISSPRFSM